MKLCLGLTTPRILVLLWETSGLFILYFPIYMLCYRGRLGYFMCTVMDYKKCNYFAFQVSTTKEIVKKNNCFILSSLLSKSVFPTVIISTHIFFVFLWISTCLVIVCVFYVPICRVFVWASILHFQPCCSVHLWIHICTKV